MTIKEFYTEIGGNYEEMLLGLGKEERVKKFVLKFPQSNILELISSALNSKDYESAFREAHNLKGMSINIGLVQLHSVSSELTESLRNGPKGDVDQLFKKVSDEYIRTCDLIKKID